jgi:hypothetical protein
MLERIRYGGANNNRSTTARCSFCKRVRSAGGATRSAHPIADPSPFSLRLTTDPASDTCGRDGFLIHGDPIADPSAGVARPHDPKPTRNSLIGPRAGLFILRTVNKCPIGRPYPSRGMPALRLTNCGAAARLTALMQSGGMPIPIARDEPERIGDMRHRQASLAHHLH